jgi:ribonuclease D
MDIITTTEALRALVDDLSHDDFVAVDTEFMRETTYWPILCLVQVAGAKRAAIVDPMADGIDLEPFWELLANEAVRKVFHAARQDIEIFLNRAGRIPHPVFDTQVAAMVCGFGDQIGYEAIVRRLAKAQIDKSSRFTDWSRRPLSEKQLAYALSDVTHLRVVYETLMEILAKSGREPWIAEEMDILTSPRTYNTEPLDAWKRIKLRLRSKKQLGVLVHLAAWREREAQEKDVPRGRIIKDDAVAEIAVQLPQTREALGGLRALPKGMGNSRLGDGIIAAVKAGLAADPASLPQVNFDEEEMSDAAQSAAEILKLALKIVCEREGIAAKLVANAADIDAIAQDDAADAAPMRGWRRKLFGDIALELKSGHAMIGFQNGRAAIIRQAFAAKAAE